MDKKKLIKTLSFQNFPHFIPAITGGKTYRLNPGKAVKPTHHRLHTLFFISPLCLEVGAMDTLWLVSIVYSTASGIYSKTSVIYFSRNWTWIWFGVWLDSSQTLVTYARICGIECASYHGPYSLRVYVRMWVGLWAQVKKKDTFLTIFPNSWSILWG